MSVIELLGFHQETGKNGETVVYVRDDARIVLSRDKKVYAVLKLPSKAKISAIEAVLVKHERQFNIVGDTISVEAGIASELYTAFRLYAETVALVISAAIRGRRYMTASHAFTALLAERAGAPVPRSTVSVSQAIVERVLGRGPSSLEEYVSTLWKTGILSLSGSHLHIFGFSLRNALSKMGLKSHIGDVEKQVIKVLDEAELLPVDVDLLTVSRLTGEHPWRLKQWHRVSDSERERVIYALLPDDVSQLLRDFLTCNCIQEKYVITALNEIVFSSEQRTRLLVEVEHPLAVGVRVIEVNCGLKCGYVLVHRGVMGTIERVLRLSEKPFAVYKVMLPTGMHAEIVASSYTDAVEKAYRYINYMYLFRSFASGKTRITVTPEIAKALVESPAVEWLDLA